MAAIAPSSINQNGTVRLMPDNGYISTVEQRPATEPILTIEDLNVFYGAVHAVADVSFAIPEHRITALIGPSGCGKSSVLRSLNRMTELIPGARVTGEVRYRGTALYAPRVDPVAVRRRIGMVFQKPTPFAKSIFDNVAWGARVTGHTTDLEARVERCLRQAALWEEVQDKLTTSGLALSGGQQQRLCLARALAVNPEVLLLDEPASALDPISTLKIEDLLRELAATYTIVIVTHNLQQAARLSDQTIFFSLDAQRRGVLVEAGPTRELFLHPRDPQTEAYITGRFG